MFVCACACVCLLLLIMLYAFQVSWFPRRPIRPSTICTFHGVLACIDSTPSLCHCLHCKSLWIKYAKFIYNTHACTQACAHTHAHTHTCTHTPGRGENTPKFCVPRTSDCILRVSFTHVCRYTQLCLFIWDCCWILMLRPSTIHTFHGVLACIDSTPSLFLYLYCESL